MHKNLTKAKCTNMHERIRKMTALLAFYFLEDSKRTEYLCIKLLHKSSTIDIRHS